jgi:hypothetical protein
MTGFTLNGVAGRIRDLETKTNGAYYVALCWLAMSRDSGKGAKRRLEDKVFGTGKPKVTSTFRNAWRIADKAFAEGFHAGHRKAVVELALDEALDFAIKALEDHKAALGVTSMAEYEAVAKYATKADIPAEAAEGPKAEGETPPADNENVDVVTHIKTAISALALEQAMEVAEWLAAHINAATAALAQPQARAA